MGVQVMQLGCAVGVATAEVRPKILCCGVPEQRLAVESAEQRPVGMGAEGRKADSQGSFVVYESHRVEHRTGHRKITGGQRAEDNRHTILFCTWTPSILIYGEVAVVPAHHPGGPRAGLTAPLVLLTELNPG